MDRVSSGRPWKEGEALEMDLLASKEQTALWSMHIQRPESGPVSSQQESWASVLAPHAADSASTPSEHEEGSKLQTGRLPDWTPDFSLMES